MGKVNVISRYPAPSANSLTQQVLYVLKLHGFVVWRQNNTGVYDPVKKIFRRNSTKKGISDVIGYKFSDRSARFIAVEIKAGRDKLSDDQQTFLKGLQEAGGFAFVIRTGRDIEEMIKKIK